METAATILASQKTCVIATNGRDGYPNAATVAFSHTSDMRFIFSTDDSTRKAANLSQDNRVAVTVTDVENRITIQAECDVLKLSREAFESSYAKAHFEKLPFTRVFQDIPTMSFYIATPVRLKLTDINQRPWKVEELIR